MELAIITHKGETDYLKAKYYAYARDLISTIINKLIEGRKDEVSKKVLGKLQQQIDALEKQNSQLKKQMDSKFDKPSNPSAPSDWAKDV